MRIITKHSILVVLYLTTSCKSTLQQSSLRADSGPEVVTQPKVYTFEVQGNIDNLIYDRRRLEFDEKDPLGGFRPVAVPVTLKSDSGTLTGIMRNRGQNSYCESFPQIKLKLDKKFQIEGQRDFKLVTGGTYPLTKPILECHEDGVIPPILDLRKNKKKQGDIYDMAESLLDYHLSTIKVDIRYIDSANGIDFKDRGYLLEDVDAAAKRYNMKAAEFPGVNGIESWRRTPHHTEEEITETIQSLASIGTVRTIYNTIKSEHKDWTEAQLGAELKTLIDTSPDKEKIEKKLSDALVDKDKILGTMKQTQQNYLKKFDVRSLAQILLFNLMVENGDSNVFGLTDHPTALKNVEILVDSKGIYYALPYDFDLTGWARSSESKVDTYVTGYDKLVADLKANDNMFILPTLKGQIDVFIERLSDKQRVSSFRTEYGDKIDIFIAALKILKTK